MSQTKPSPEDTHRAGAFDVRSFIALLIGLYGLVLLLMGLFGTSDQDLAKADDFNVNLWAGLGMLVVAGAMQAWAMLRPVVVPDDPDAEGPPGAAERASAADRA